MPAGDNPTVRSHLSTGVTYWFVPLCRTTQPIRGPPVGKPPVAAIATADSDDYERDHCYQQRLSA
jgi:hypothetical protein